MGGEGGSKAQKAQNEGKVLPSPPACAAVSFRGTSLHRSNSLRCLFATSLGWLRLGVVPINVAVVVAVVVHINIPYSRGHFADDRNVNCSAAVSTSQQGPQQVRKSTKPKYGEIV